MFPKFSTQLLKGVFESKICHFYIYCLINLFYQFNTQFFIIRHIQQLENTTTNQTTQINSLKERLNIELNRNRQASGLQGMEGIMFFY